MNRIAGDKRKSRGSDASMKDGGGARKKVIKHQ